MQSTARVFSILRKAIAPALAAIMMLAQPASVAAEDELSVKIDRAEKKLYVKRNGETLRTFEVAVGKSDHPTPLGSWKIYQVDINPDWTPPDSSWAEDAEPKPPGHPDNPMGRARLIFDPPYTIHGTEDEESLGKAESHGSIRVGNEAVIELAEMMLRQGLVWQGEDWFQAMLDQPDEMFEIELERPVPINIVGEDD